MIRIHTHKIRHDIIVQVIRDKGVIDVKLTIRLLVTNVNLHKRWIGYRHVHVVVARWCTTGQSDFCVQCVCVCVECGMWYVCVCVTSTLSKQ